MLSGHLQIVCIDSNVEHCRKAKFNVAMADVRFLPEYGQLKEDSGIIAGLTAQHHCYPKH